MGSNAVKSKYIAIGIIFIFFFIFPAAFSPLNAQQAESESENPDSAGIEYPERMPDRKTWEWILSSPGLIVSLPFTVVLKIAEVAVSNLYQPSVVGWMYDVTTSDDSLRALRPAYSSRSGLGFKIYQKDLFNKESYIELSAKAGLNNRQKYQLKFERFDLHGERLYMDLSFGYRFLPDERFYGIGPDSKKDDETAYALEKAWITLDLGTKLSRKIDLMGGLSLEHSTVLNPRIDGYPSTKEVFADQDIPGLECEVRIMGAQLTAKYDSRDSRGGPRRGQLIGLSIGMFGQVDDDNYKYWLAAADIRQYVHLFYGRTLVLRLGCQLTRPVSGKTIPFYNLSNLGPTETIRGFSRSRFRDRDMALGSVEYRYPIYSRRKNVIDAFIFVDAGQVSPALFEEFETEDIHVGFGGGFRIWSSDAESFNLMIGKSKERLRIDLVVNE